MAKPLPSLQRLIEEAKQLATVRVAVANAGQQVVLETIRDAMRLGLVRPTLIGNPEAIRDCASKVGLDSSDYAIAETVGEAAAAEAGVRLVRENKCDVLMKGFLHTDTFMRAILDGERGLRMAGQRVSHAFLCEVPTHDGLLLITDAAINIAPDLNAKAQILQNAIALLHLLGVERPKVAVLSAIETVNPAIGSTVDAACLALMSQRGQITGALVEGPLAFDNAVSRRAAEEKGISSEVAGDCDILLVPDLVSGNILAKNLEYLANAIAAGIVLGLRAPVVLSSRSDPAPSRLAALALAALMHHRMARPHRVDHKTDEASLRPLPQPEALCCPLPR